MQDWRFFAYAQNDNSLSLLRRQLPQRGSECRRESLPLCDHIITQMITAGSRPRPTDYYIILHFAFCIYYCDILNRIQFDIFAMQKRYIFALLKCDMIQILVHEVNISYVQHISHALAYIANPQGFISLQN